MSTSGPARTSSRIYLAINRFGQVPALVDGDLKLCRSGSILLYLADKFGKMGGKTPEDKARVPRVAVLGIRSAGARTSIARARSSAAS